MLSSKQSPNSKSKSVHKYVNKRGQGHRHIKILKKQTYLSRRTYKATRYEIQTNISDVAGKLTTPLTKTAHIVAGVN